MNGKKGRIFIYLSDIRPLYKEELQNAVYQSLPEIRQKKADACRSGQPRAASLAAGFLAQYALEQYALEQYSLERDDQGYEIFYEQSGAPRVQAPEGAPNVYISLSHSGDCAVCALCAQPVGIDIQQEKPIKTGMLRHFLTAEEKEFFFKRFQMTGAERELPADAENAFLKDWTAKESYMKLTGQGMSMGFSALTVDWDTGWIWEKKAPHKRAQLITLEAPKGYFMTACRAGE